MFHKHNWKVIAKTYAPPYTGAGKVKGTALLVEKLTCGSTEILLKCECGKTKVVEMLGKIEK